jgi:hypothetical protein
MARVRQEAVQEAVRNATGEDVVAWANAFSMDYHLGMWIGGVILFPIGALVGSVVRRVKPDNVKLPFTMVAAVTPTRVLLFKQALKKSPQPLAVLDRRALDVRTGGVLMRKIQLIDRQAHLRYFLYAGKLDGKLKRVAAALGQELPAAAPAARS